MRISVGHYVLDVAPELQAAPAPGWQAHWRVYDTRRSLELARWSGMAGIFPSAEAAASAARTAGLGAIDALNAADQCNS